ncbi:MULTISPECIES: hypothetical protein [Luteimonas]|uniref:hypothetical protein n=1 Tax=Luteimonas TaxID=83614 RepID=UPI000C7A17F1|nr:MULTISPECIES: hypothetical protein [Luteimonas]
MGMLKLAAAGALSYFGYKAWQKRQAAPATNAVTDDSTRTAPHGDPLATATTDTTASTRSGPQTGPTTV